MNADLEKLLDLQTKDELLLEVDLRLGALGDEGAELDAAVTRTAGEVESAQRSLAELAKRQRELEVRIESYRTLQERRRTRMEQVKNAREAQALMTEMDMSRAVLLKEEGEWLKRAEQVQGLEARIAEGQAALEALQAEQAEARADIAARETALQAERTVALAAREASAATLEKVLRMRYDRLRTNREGAVVVAVSGVACGSCFTAVPMSRRSQLRTGLLVEGCEACGVILYAEEMVAG